MNFLEQATLSEDGPFQSRVRQAAIKAAVIVAGETTANTPQAIAAHTKRTEFARQILIDPTSHQRALAMSVLGSPLIGGATVNDNELTAAVTAMWDAWSGVTKDPAVA